MATALEIAEQHADVIRLMADLTEKVERENRDYTPEENDQFANYREQCVKLGEEKRKAERREDVAAMKEELNRVQPRQSTNFAPQREKLSTKQINQIWTNWLGSKTVDSEQLARNAAYGLPVRDKHVELQWDTATTNHGGELTAATLLPGVAQSLKTYFNAAEHFHSFYTNDGSTKYLTRLDDTGNMAREIAEAEEADDNDNESKDPVSSRVTSSTTKYTTDELLFT